MNNKCIVRVKKGTVIESTEEKAKKEKQQAKNRIAEINHKIINSSLVDKILPFLIELGLELDEKEQELLDEREKLLKKVK